MHYVRERSLGMTRRTKGQVGKNRLITLTAPYVPFRDSPGACGQRT